MMRSPLWTTLLIAVALAVIVGQAREELVLPVVAGALGGGFSWWLGFTQGKRHGWTLAQRWQARRVLESFTHAAERMLAAAPDDLDEQGEAMREHLQRHYHEAQELLAQMDERP